MGRSRSRSRSRTRKTKSRDRHSKKEKKGKRPPSSERPSNSSKKKTGGGVDLGLLESMMVDKPTTASACVNVVTAVRTSVANQHLTASVTAASAAHNAQVEQAEYFTPEQAQRMFPRLNPNIAREVRRVYVGCLPPYVTNVEVKEYFERRLRPILLKEKNIVVPPNEAICVEVDMRTDNEKKPYAFVEMMSEDAAGLAIDHLNNAQFVSRDKTVSEIKVNRPSKHYPGPPPVGALPHTVYVTGFPISITKEEITETFTEFGTVKKCWICVDAATKVPKGNFYLTFESDEGVEKTIAELDGETLETLQVHVRRAQEEDKVTVVQHKEITFADGLMDFLRLGQAVSVPKGPGGFTPLNVVGSDMGGGGEGDAQALPEVDLFGNFGPINTPEAFLRAVLNTTCGPSIEHVIREYFQNTNRSYLGPTRVLVLMNLTDDKDMLSMDDEEYQVFVKDVETEVNKYGLVEDVIVPRRKPAPPDPSKYAGNPYSNVAAPSEPMLAITSAPGSAPPPPSPPPTTMTYAEAVQQYYEDCKHPVKNGLGKVFVVYQNVEEAKHAKNMLTGRRFNGRTVITSFIHDWLVYPELAAARGIVNPSSYLALAASGSNNNGDGPPLSIEYRY
eukprot:PhF_6_TR22516/c0_g1_i1/m.31949/K12837/U2AF2; splicing factor U2AF 65 kDa subunit